MCILYAVVFGIILGYATRGRLKYFALRPLNWKGMALLAFAIQLVIFSDLPFLATLPDLYIIVMHYASYILLLIFIARNIKNLGITVVGVGIFLNCLVIFLNGGYMPANPQTLEKTSVGQTVDLLNQGEPVHNSANMTGNTLLPWLGDIFYLPSWIPFSNVFSIGDIIIAIGICIYIVKNMHPVYGTHKSSD